MINVNQYPHQIVEEAETKIAELVEALDTIADYGGYLTGEDALEMKRVACSALERLKGEIE